MQDIAIDNRYRLITPCGSGKQGTVYLAYDQETEREVAIKMPIGPQEYQLLASIHHAHVPACYDCCQVETSKALVMEWIDGETLRSYLSRRQDPLALWEMHQIVETLCTLLFSLETQPAPIRYEDLHPGNVLRRTSDGHLFLVDFGHASWLPQDGMAARSGWLMRIFVEYDLLPHLAQGKASHTISAWCRTLCLQGLQGSAVTVEGFYHQWVTLLETLDHVWSGPSHANLQAVIS